MSWLARAGSLLWKWGVGGWTGLAAWGGLTLGEKLGSITGAPSANIEKYAAREPLQAEVVAAVKGAPAARKGGGMGFISVLGKVAPGLAAVVRAGRTTTNVATKASRAATAVATRGRSAVSGAMTSWKSLPVAARAGIVGAAGVGAGVGLANLGGGGPSGPAGGIPSEMVAYSWDTGTAIFYRLMDGRIACQKRNGVWKVWRPARHIVVPRNPRIGTLIRADKRVDKLMKNLARRAGVHSSRKKSRQGSVATAGVHMIKQ